MKTDIILAGVGGQGIITIASILGEAALLNNLYVKQSEIHGMSQRGGDVQSDFRISDRPIFSDLIPKGNADLIVSMEPMEALRYIPFLKENGWIISNSRSFVNVDNYPDENIIISEIKHNAYSLCIDIEKMSIEIGNPKSANIVLLGAASPFIIIEEGKIEEAIKFIFQKKGINIINKNIDAFRKGREITLSQIKK